jgi:hypothetical protein
MPSSPAADQDTHSQAAATGIFISVVLLTIASVALVVKSAADEPYIVFQPWDAFLNVGIGSLLMALWSAWVFFLCRLIGAHRLHPVWYVALPWAVLCLFYLAFCPFGYLADIHANAP